MPQFHPAKTRKWVTLPYFLYNALELALHCRVDLDEASKRMLRSLPRGSGVILVSNHTDEMDIRVLIEAARQCGKKFRFMVNQEAFEEMKGFAGFWLERIGCFSVERGAGDAESREFALEVIRRAREALVMFPEGEIFYLNDEVQPFKTGAVQLGFEALQAMRRENPRASVYVVPVSLKYGFAEPVMKALKNRMRKLEASLQIRPGTVRVPARLNAMIAEVVERYRMNGRVREAAGQWAKFGGDIRAWRASAVAQLEKKYAAAWEKPSRRLMDRAHRLASELRKKMESGAVEERKGELKRDLETLKRTVWFAGWAPQYHMEKPSAERLAETVMKLEREILGVRRPRAMGKRAVQVRAGKPVSLGWLMDDYARDSREVCRRTSEYLRQTIQSLVEGTKPPALEALFTGKKELYAANLHVVSEDGQKIYFDHYQAGHDKAVIIAPGFFNSKSAALMKELAVLLAERYDAAVMDFRGHGQSPGVFYWTAKEYLDLRAVMAYLRPRYRSLGLIGFSLGAATSLIAASMPDADLQSVAAVSPPSEFEKIEYRFWELDPDHDIFYNLVGEGRKGKGVRPGPFWLKKQKPIDCVAKIRAPLLFLHGTKDWLILPSHSERLYAAAPGRKRLVMIEGGPHAEYLILKNREAAVEALLRWFEETL